MQIVRNELDDEQSRVFMAAYHGMAPHHGDRSSIVGPVRARTKYIVQSFAAADTARRTKGTAPGPPRGLSYLRTIGLPRLFLRSWATDENG